MHGYVLGHIQISEGFKYSIGALRIRGFIRNLDQIRILDVIDL